MPQTMYTVSGKLIDVYNQPVVNRDTGQKEFKAKIQLVGIMPIRDSEETRKEMVTLTVESLDDYKPLLDEQIEVPFGFFSPTKGQTIQFVPKGSKPLKVARSDQESVSRSTSATGDLKG